MPALYHTYQFVYGKKIGVIKLHPALARLIVESNDVKDVRAALAAAASTNTCTTGLIEADGSAVVGFMQVIHGRMLPMLVPPRPWLTYNSGGYLTVDRTHASPPSMTC